MSLPRPKTRFTCEFALPHDSSVHLRVYDVRGRGVAVLADGFAWNGKTYRSLSKVAQAITGTRWNGPKFFGLRDKPSEDPQSS